MKIDLNVPDSFESDNHLIPYLRGIELIFTEERWSTSICYSSADEIELSASSPQCGLQFTLVYRKVGKGEKAIYKLKTKRDTSGEFNQSLSRFSVNCVVVDNGEFL